MLWLAVATDKPRMTVRKALTRLSIKTVLS
jgi:hypothetical protein